VKFEGHEDPRAPGSAVTVTSPDRFDEVLAALADPTRRSIVRRLADGDATVQELAEPFSITDTGDAMSTTPAATEPTTWELEREVVLVRVLDAPRDAVFAAWTDPASFCQWFGPDGFTCTVREMDVRPGGRASFDMTSADGTVYTNRFDYLEILPGEKLVMDHGSDIDDDPARFRVTVTFDAQSDGKTVLTLRQLHPTVEQRAAVIGFGAVELGLQTMQKLARFLGTT
jgi:uncharacterized protein YndB with AHSA1/START domain